MRRGVVSRTCTYWEAPRRLRRAYKAACSCSSVISCRILPADLDGVAHTDELHGPCFRRDHPPHEGVNTSASLFSCYQLVTARLVSRFSCGVFLCSMRFS